MKRNVFYLLFILMSIIFNTAGCKPKEIHHESLLVDKHETNFPEGLSIDGHIGFYGDGTEESNTQKDDISEAMAQCGIKDSIVTVSSDKDLIEAVEHLLQEQCKLIVLGCDSLELDIVEELANTYPDISFLVNTSESMDCANVVTYYFNQEDVSDFLNEIKVVFDENNYQYDEENLYYEISYTRIFEEILTVYSEIGMVMNSHYILNISNDSVVIHGFNPEELPDDLSKSYGALTEQYDKDAFFIYEE